MISVVMHVITLRLCSEKYHKEFVMIGIWSVVRLVHLSYEREAL